jgi:hypothetical protein
MGMILVWGAEKVLELDGCDDYTVNVNVKNTTEVYT